MGTITACTNGSEQNKEETQKDKSDKASKKDKKDKKEVLPAVVHYIVGVWIDMHYQPHSDGIKRHSHLFLICATDNRCCYRRYV